MKKLILVPLLIFVLLLSACNKDKEANTPDTEPAEENTGEAVNGNEEETEEESEGIANEVFKSKLSGLPGDKEKVERRPIAIMIDNSRAARWQAGLSQAEIVYEILAEGTITRYMALFVKNDPVAIGPIRSARPYFITKLLEYDAAYAHCGGSSEAKADIKALRIKDLDEISKAGGYYYRNYNVGKNAPHNLYASMENLRKAQEVFGYTGDGDYESFNFHDKDTDIVGNDANEVLIKYSADNTTKYVYDSDNKVYTRYKDGQLHIDENDKVKITAKNILIQKSKTWILGTGGGKKGIALTGEGKGMYITNGKVIDVTWKKGKRSDKTRYYDENGKEIILNPGHTWIQVVKTNTPITIK